MQVRQDIKVNNLEAYEWAKKHDVHMHLDNLNIDKMGRWVAQQRVAFDLVILGFWFWREMQTDHVKSIPETVVHRGPQNAHLLTTFSYPSVTVKQRACMVLVSSHLLTVP